jgi:hypothetical protein
LPREISKFAYEVKSTSNFCPAVEELTAVVALLENASKE